MVRRASKYIAVTGARGLVHGTREEIGCGAACIVHAPEERATNVKGTSHYYVSIRPENSRGLAIRVASPHGAEIDATREPRTRRKASIESVKKGRGEIKRVDEMKRRRRRRRTKEVLKKVVGREGGQEKKRGGELN